MRPTLALLTILLFAWPSQARVSEQMGYSKTQAFNAALRYLRVEKQYEVTEKDADSGYLLFEYPTQEKRATTLGSVEVIDRDEEILLVVQLAKMPEYHERHFMKGLLEKLHDDYGAPRRPRDPPPQEDQPSEQEKPEVPRYRIGKPDEEERSHDES